MNGLSFVARDKTDAYIRRVVAGDSSADLLWNDTSVATFVLDDDLDAVPILMAPGARVSVMLNDGELFRGRVARTPGQMPNGQVTFTVESDFRKLKDWHGWPKPTAAIGAQTVEFAVYSGKSEAVFKSALSANITRLGVPWTVASNHGWGTTTQASLRFDPLFDKIIPPLITDQLGVVLTYPSDGHVQVDVRQPNTIDGLLDPVTGVVDQFVFDRWAPAATRVVVGLAGDGTSRVFTTAVNNTRETAWGDIIEVFKDGTVDDGSSGMVDAAQALADGADGASISMDLIQTPRFQFLTDYQLGDVLTFTISGVPGSEVITKVSITDNASDGLTITPHIGDISGVDPLAQLAARIRAMKKRMRAQGRR